MGYQFLFDLYFAFILRATYLTCYTYCYNIVSDILSPDEQNIRFDMTYFVQQVIKACEICQ